jgi:feruloyl-CoA synthase
MTETSPCALWVLRDCARAGELGVPSPGLEIKLVPNADKLEIRYRGPNVSPGYWRSPEATREAFDRDGFLCSGDAVRWRDPANPDAGFLFDGRLAEDFKLDTGTWVHVGSLRSRAVEVGAPYVQDVVVTGHDRQEVGLLIVPNFEECCALANRGSDAPLARVCEAPAVRGFFQQLVNKLHAEGTGCASRVGRALIMQEPLSLSRGEVTDKGTVNQRAVLEHRAALVDLLYSDGPTSEVILPSDCSLPNGA